MTKPTENELFEQWKLKQKIKAVQPLNYNSYLIFEAWNARAEIADKEKAKLKQMYEGAKRLLEFNTQKNPLLKEIAELQAQINELREAILIAKREYDKAPERVNMDNIAIPLDEALAKTAPQCLIQHDNEVIERCAKVVDESYAFDSNGFAKEIRALKGKQNET